MPLDSRYSLQNGDLKDLVVPKISIDEFNPKTGEAKDVIVTAFYMSEKAPAEDLTQFIETGAYETLDVETSPNPDDDGNHLIFIEMKRDEDFMEKVDQYIVIHTLADSHRSAVECLRFDWFHSFTDLGAIHWHKRADRGDSFVQNPDLASQRKHDYQQQDYQQPE